MADSYDDTTQFLGQEVRMLENRLANTKEMIRRNTGGAVQKIAQLPPLATAPQSARGPERPGSKGGRYFQPHPMNGASTKTEVAFEQHPPGSAAAIAYDRAFSLVKGSEAVVSTPPVGGPSSSRIILNQDVKKHREQWEVFHRCQKLFRLADELWQLGDEHRRTTNPEKLMNMDNGTAETRMRKARDELIRIAKELYDGPLVDTDNGISEARSTEKVRLRSMLKDSEDRCAGLEIANAAYIQRFNRLKERNDKLRGKAVRGWLDAHSTGALTPAFQAWRSAVREVQWERSMKEYPARVMSVLSRTLEGVRQRENEALVESCMSAWINSFVEAKRVSEDQKNRERLERERKKKLAAAERAFGDTESYLLMSTFRSWQKWAKDSALDAGRRQRIMENTMRAIQSSGWALVSQILTRWANDVRIQRSRRVGKDRLLKTMLDKLGAGVRQNHKARFLTWAKYVSDQRNERQLQESLAREMKAKMKHMQMIEKAFKGDIENTYFACWKAWRDDFEISRLQARMRKQAMDSSLKRVFGLQSELMSMCFNPWVADVKQINAQRKQERVEQLRRNALAQFQKSLESSITGLKKTFINAWREHLDLIKIRQKRKKEMLDRVAANFLRTEMLMKILVPFWAKEAQQSSLLKNSTSKMKKSMERSRQFIIKLRDITILQLVWQGWCFRAFG